SRCELRQVFTNLHADGAGGDRPKGAPHLGRGVRFQVEGVNVTGSAREENDDYTPGTLPLGAACAGSRPCVMGEKRWQPQPEQARVADLQQLAPRHPHRVSMAGALSVHSEILCGDTETERLKFVPKAGALNQLADRFV